MMKSLNINIRNLYASEFSMISFSFYKSNLSLVFYPWLGKDKMGRGLYDMKKGISTTINDDNVAVLYLLSQQIIDGVLVNPCQYVIKCNKEATVFFEYDLNRVYLNIDKKGERVVHEFPVETYKEKENGVIVEKVMQSGLVVFAQTLHTYLAAVGADRQMNKQLTEVFDGSKPSFMGWSQF